MGRAEVMDLYGPNEMTSTHSGNPVCCAAALGACSSRGGGREASSRRFELVCDSSDTRESSTLFCTRIDTRTGDVKRIDISKLSQSNGPTAAAEERDGTYQLVCDSTDTEARSDFRCVRINTETGELLLVGLPKVEVIP